MKAQMPDVIVPPLPPVPPVLPPNPPERDTPERDDPAEPDWSDDELPPAVNRTPGYSQDRLSAAEARLSVLMWLTCGNLVVALLTLRYLCR